MKLAEILIIGRKEHKLPFRKLAAETGVDAALLNKFEKRERIPTKIQLEKLVAVLELDQKAAFSAWLSDKIYQLIEGEEFVLESLQAVEAQIVMETEAKYHSLQQIPENLQEALSVCDELQNRWHSLKPLNRTQISKMEEYFRLNYTYESNRIEGNTLTLQETHLIVNEGLTIGGKSMREHLEVVNHAEAIEYIVDVSKNKVELNERVLKQIHYLVLKGIDKKNAGVYRTSGVMISGSAYTPPESFLLNELMEEVFVYYQQARKVLHPVVLAAEMHERIVRIHPFIDGNGRTTRLIMNLILMQNGFPIANIKGDLENRLKYYQTLENAPADNRESFVAFISENVTQALKAYIKLSE